MDNLRSMQGKSFLGLLRIGSLAALIVGSQEILNAQVPPHLVSSTWSGDYSLSMNGKTYENIPISVQLDFSLTDVTGNWSTGTGISGSVAATFGDDWEWKVDSGLGNDGISTDRPEITAPFNVPATVPACLSNYKGYGTLAPNTREITFNYIGYHCDGSKTTGEGTLTLVEEVQSWYNQGMIKNAML